MTLTPSGAPLGATLPAARPLLSGESPYTVADIATSLQSLAADTLHMLRADLELLVTAVDLTPSRRQVAEELYASALRLRSLAEQLPR